MIKDESIDEISILKARRQPQQSAAEAVPAANDTSASEQEDSSTESQDRASLPTLACTDQQQQVEPAMAAPSTCSNGGDVMDDQKRYLTFSDIASGIDPEATPNQAKSVVRSETIEFESSLDLDRYPGLSGVGSGSKSGMLLKDAIMRRRRESGAKVLRQEEISFLGIVRRRVEHTYRSSFQLPDTSIVAVTHREVYHSTDPEVEVIVTLAQAAPSGGLKTKIGDDISVSELARENRWASLMLSSDGYYDDQLCMMLLGCHRSGPAHQEETVVEPNSSAAAEAQADPNVVDTTLASEISLPHPFEYQSMYDGDKARNVDEDSEVVDPVDREALVRRILADIDASYRCGSCDSIRPDNRPSAVEIGEFSVGRVGDRARVMSASMDHLAVTETRSRRRMLASSERSQVAESDSNLAAKVAAEKTSANTCQLSNASSSSLGYDSHSSVYSSVSRVSRKLSMSDRVYLEVLSDESQLVSDGEENGDDKESINRCQTQEFSLPPTSTFSALVDEPHHQNREKIQEQQNNSQQQQQKQLQRLSRAEVLSMDSFETASEKTTEHTKDTVDTSVDQAFTASVYARRPSLSLPDSGELAPAAAPAIEQVYGPANKDYGAIVRQRAKKFESAAPRYGSRTAEERRSYQELQDTGAVAQTAQVHKAYIKQHEMQPAPGQFCLDVESDSQERFVYQRNQDLESKERVDEITHSSRSDLSAIEHEAMMIKSSLKSAQTYRSRPNIIPSTLAGPTAANESAASVSKGEHRAQDDLTQILSANIGDSFAAKELSSVENASSVKREQLEPSMTPKTPEPSKQENLAPLALEDTEISEEKSSAAKGSTQATNIHHMIPTKKPILSSPVNKKSASTTSVADHRGQEDLIQIQHTSGTASGIEISIVENSEATEETQFSPSLSESVLVCPAAPNESISLSAATASQELRGQEDLTLHIPSTVCVENEMDKIRKSDELKLLSPSLPTSVRVRPTDPKFKGQENFIAGTQVLNATIKDENEADEGQFGCSSTFPVKAVSKIGSTSTFAVTKHRGQEDRMLRIPAAEISAEACEESGGNDKQFNPPDLLSSIRTNTAEQPNAISSSSSSQTDSDSETDEEASAYGEIPRQVALGQSLISTPLTTISEELPLSNQPKTLQPSESIAIVGRHSDLSKEPTVLIKPSAPLVRLEDMELACSSVGSQSDAGSGTEYVEDESFSKASSATFQLGRGSSVSTPEKSQSSNLTKTSDADTAPASKSLGKETQKKPSNKSRSFSGRNRIKKTTPSNKPEEARAAEHLQKSVTSQPVSKEQKPRASADDSLQCLEESFSMTLSATLQAGRFVTSHSTSNKTVAAGTEQKSVPVPKSSQLNSAAAATKTFDDSFQQTQKEEPKFCGSPSSTGKSRSFSNRIRVKKSTPGNNSDVKSTEQVQKLVSVPGSNELKASATPSIEESCNSTKSQGDQNLAAERPSKKAIKSSFRSKKTTGSVSPTSPLVEDDGKKADQQKPEHQMNSIVPIEDNIEALSFSQFASLMLQSHSDIAIESSNSLQLQCQQPSLHRSPCNSACAMNDSLKQPELIAFATSTSALKQNIRNSNVGSVNCTADIASVEALSFAPKRPLRLCSHMEPSVLPIATPSPAAAAATSPTPQPRRFKFSRRRQSQKKLSKTSSPSSSPPVERSSTLPMPSPFSPKSPSSTLSSSWPVTQDDSKPDSNQQQTPVYSRQETGEFYLRTSDGEENTGVEDDTRSSAVGAAVTPLSSLTPASSPSPTPSPSLPSPTGFAGIVNNPLSASSDESEENDMASIGDSELSDARSVEASSDKPIERQGAAATVTPAAAASKSLPQPLPADPFGAGAIDFLLACLNRRELPNQPVVAARSNPYLSVTPAAAAGPTGVNPAASASMDELNRRAYLSKGIVDVKQQPRHRRRIRRRRHRLGGGSYYRHSSSALSLLREPSYLALALSIRRRHETPSPKRSRSYVRYNTEDTDEGEADDGEDLNESDDYEEEYSYYQQQSYYYGQTEADRRAQGARQLDKQRRARSMPIPGPEEVGGEVDGEEAAGATLWPYGRRRKRQRRQRRKGRRAVFLSAANLVYETSL